MTALVRALILAAWALFLGHSAALAQAPIEIQVVVKEQPPKYVKVRESGATYRFSRGNVARVPVHPQSIVTLVYEGREGDSEYRYFYSFRVNNPTSSFTARMDGPGSGCVPNLRDNLETDVSDSDVLLQSLMVLRRMVLECETPQNRRMSATKYCKALSHIHLDGRYLTYSDWIGVDNKTCVQRLLEIIR